MALKLYYWQIRGLGAPCRMMMSYAGAEYTEERYTAETMDNWFGKDKPQCQESNPLANLPFLVDGDKKITQSNAVMLYLARKLDLAGTGAQVSDCEMVLLDCYDLRDHFVQMVYWYKGVCRDLGEYEASKGTYFKDKLDPFLKKYEAWLNVKGTDFFAGTKPTAADFAVFEMIDQHCDLAADWGQTSVLEQYPKIQAFKDRFRALPELQKYFDSEAYKLPCNVPQMTFWSGRGSSPADGAPPAKS